MLDNVDSHSSKIATSDNPDQNEIVHQDTQSWGWEGGQQYHHSLVVESNFIYFTSLVCHFSSLLELIRLTSSFQNWNEQEVKCQEKCLRNVWFSCQAEISFKLKTKIAKCQCQWHCTIICLNYSPFIPIY